MRRLRVASAIAVAVTTTAAAAWAIVPRATAGPSAVTFTVTTPTDGAEASQAPGTCVTAQGLCSLRAALQEAAKAAAIGAPATVVVPAGTYTLSIAGADETDGSTGNLLAAGQLTIQGAGSGSTIIDGAGTGRVLDVAHDANVTLSGVTIQGGKAAGDGSGLRAGFATVALTDVVFAGDTANGDGGGMFASNSNVTLSHVTFSDASGLAGGGLYADDSAVTADAVTATGDSAEEGGALAVLGAPALSVTGSTFSSDGAVKNGGAIWIQGATAGKALDPTTLPTLHVTSSTFTGDQAGTTGGAIDVTDVAALEGNGSVDFTGDTFTTDEAASGGAVNVDPDSTAITNSTFTSNVADGTSAGDVGGSVDGAGGAIRATGPLTLSGDTFSANQSGGDGGGVYAVGDLSASTTTFSANTAGGVGGALASTGTLTVSATTFSADHAAATGGGVWNGAPGGASISGSSFTGETTDAGFGAAIYHRGGPFSAAGTTVPPADVYLDTTGLGTSVPGQVFVPGPATGQEVLPDTSVSGASRRVGNDRIATAIAVSQARWPSGAQAVVLSRADDWADGLAATPLAVAKHGPVLLTPSTALDTRVAAEILRLLPRGATVYLVGGDSALSPSVASSITEAGFVAVRLDGPDRYATAVAVAGALGDPTSVVEVTGTDFADALSGGAAAAHMAAAVLLTDGSTPAPETAAYLAAHTADRRWAVGGPAEAADPGAVGVAGADRYATSVAVATTFFAAPVTVGIASGRAFADALSGGADIASAGGPLLLTDPVSLSPAVAAYLTADKSALTSVVIYGGPSAVADQVVAAASVVPPGP